MKTKVLEYVDTITKAGALAIFILVAYSLVQNSDSITHEEGQVSEVMKKWCDDSTGDCFTEIKQGDKVISNVQVENKSVYNKLVLNKKYKFRKIDNIIKSIIEEVK